MNNDGESPPASNYTPLPNSLKPLPQETFESSPAPKKDLVVNIQTPPPKEEKPEKKINTKPFIILATTFILVVIALIIGAFVKYNQEKEKIIELANTNVKSIQKLENKYSQILTLIKSAGENQPSESENRVLGEESKPSSDLGEVLGLEEDNELARQYIEHLRDSEVIVDEITLNSLKINNKLNQTMILNRVETELEIPITKTNEFTTKTKPLLTYFKNVESLNVEYSAIAFDVGAGIAESALRNYDDVSIEKLSGKLDILRNYKTEMEEIDTTGLSSDLHKRHQKEIDTFDLFFQPLDELYLALKNKDALLAQKAVVSLYTQSVAESEKGLASYISLWQENYR